MRSFAGTRVGRIVGTVLLLVVAWTPISLWLFNFSNLPTTIDRSQNASIGVTLQSSHFVLKSPDD